jgi:hypothetical protein
MAMLMLGLSLSLMLGCGNKICDCLEEAEKENPDQAKMEECRDKFAKMEMNEVQQAIESCGKTSH